MKTLKVLWLMLVVLSVVATSCVSAKAPVVVEKTVVVEKVVEKQVTSVPVDTKPTKVLTSIVVPLGWLNNDEFVALQAAQDQGYYEAVGLNVTLVSGGGSTGFEPIRAVSGFDNSVKIGVPAALSLVLKAYAEDADVVALAALTQYEPAGFIALLKPGLQAKGPCDFKGRTVAMQTEATWYVDALAAMCPADQGGPLKSGKDFTVIPAGWTPDCLESGQCDFYCGWRTNQLFYFDQKGMKEGKDYGFFLASDYLPFYFGDVLITTKAWLKDNPDQVKAFVQASMKGLDYVVKNPEDAVRIASSVEGVTKEHAAWRIPVQNGLAESAETKTHGLGYLDPVKVQKMIDFLYANGQISKTFKAEEVINNSFLP